MGDDRKPQQQQEKEHPLLQPRHPNVDDYRQERNKHDNGDQGRGRADRLPFRSLSEAPRQEQHRHRDAWKAYRASHVVKRESLEYASQTHEQRPDDQQPESIAGAPGRVMYAS
jgi:hypothetical protein